jgi:hypothetical protein
MKRCGGRVGGYSSGVVLHTYLPTLHHPAPTVLAFCSLMSLSLPLSVRVSRSDSSPKWTPALLRELGVTLDKDDGCFFMSWADFKR